MYWPKLSDQKIKERVFEALNANQNYRSEKILGLPATALDENIFHEDAPFLKDAAFLSTLLANPNHIGCHTLEGEKEPVFSGTQALEKELIALCAEQIFAAQPGTYDGYVASGGTEANIEAVWIYRNYYYHTKNAKPEEIAVVFSEDSHYSFHKACNLLGLQSLIPKVNETNREINLADLQQQLISAKNKGTKYFIVNVNLSTTMFGSIDDIGNITSILDSVQLDFKLHIDAAFGGFIYPFTQTHSDFNFSNPLVSSITIDGHKMLQSPYGTGIFLVRKNLIGHVCTKEAAYVPGNDYTLCGSRSGANAVSLWMILHSHGSMGWTQKMQQLLDQTRLLCEVLKKLNIPHFNHPKLNIVTIRAEYISPALATKYTLVPDDHHHPSWYKIVMMPHVRNEVISQFLDELASDLQLLKHSHK